jgi:peptidoglycan/xylan/chitin deacetylase (PgdA/CDA1 family)
MSSDIVRTVKGLARRIVGRPIFGRSILIYHRIAEVGFDPWNIAVSPDEFSRQLSELRSKTVLPLREFARLHQQKQLPRNAVAITFDDGYACNALVAAPILESFGYPATFFIVSGAIERADEFWWDQLEAIFHAPEFDNETAARVLARYTLNRAGDEAVRRPPAAFLALWDLLRGLSTAVRCQYLDELRRHLGLEKKTRPSHRPMTEAELRALAANPLFEIGGHTATHPSLPALAPAEQKEEIIEGSRFLEATLGKPILTFAYPFGEFEQGTRDIVMAAGFECAVSAKHRRVRPSDNQFELPRRQVVNRYAHSA